MFSYKIIAITVRDSQIGEILTKNIRGATGFFNVMFPLTSSVDPIRLAPQLKSFIKSSDDVLPFNSLCANALIGHALDALREAANLYALIKYRDVEELTKYFETSQKRQDNYNGVFVSMSLRNTMAVGMSMVNREYILKRGIIEFSSEQLLGMFQFLAPESHQTHKNTTLPIGKVADRIVAEIIKNKLNGFIEIGAGLRGASKLALHTAYEARLYAETKKAELFVPKSLNLAPFFGALFLGSGLSWLAQSPVPGLLGLSALLFPGVISDLKTVYTADRLYRHYESIFINKAQ